VLIWARAHNAPVHSSNLSKSPEIRSIAYETFSILPDINFELSYHAQSEYRQRNRPQQNVY
jgi:hypothetical protein